MFYKYGKPKSTTLLNFKKQQLLHELNNKIQAKLPELGRQSWQGLARANGLVRTFYMVSEEVRYADSLDKLERIDERLSNSLVMKFLNGESK